MENSECYTGFNNSKCHFAGEKASMKSLDSLC